MLNVRDMFIFDFAWNVFNRQV